MKTGRPVPPRRNLRADLIRLIGSNCTFQTEALHPELVRDVVKLVYLVIFNINNENRGNKAAILSTLDEMQRRSDIRHYTDLGSQVHNLSTIRDAISNDLFDHFDFTPELRVLPESLYKDAALAKSIFLLCDYFCCRLARPAILDHPNVQYVTGLFTSQTLLSHETDEHKWKIVLRALETLFNPFIDLEKYRILQQMLEEDRKFEKQQVRNLFSKIHHNSTHTPHLRDVLQMICMFITEKTIQTACDEKIAKTIHNAFFKNHADAKYDALGPVSLIMGYYHEPAADEQKAELVHKA